MSITFQLSTTHSMSADIRAWAGQDYEMTPDPAAPTLEDLTIQPSGFGGWNIHGFVKAGNAALATVYVKFFPRNSDGFISGQLGSNMVGPVIDAGNQLEFNTSDQPEQFSSYLSVAEFTKAQ